MPSKALLLQRFFLLSLVLISHQFYGQVQIYKDPVSCLYGLKDPSGAWLLKPEYENLHKEGLGYITSKNSKYGFIDLNGRVVNECKYDLVDPLRVYTDSQKETRLYIKLGIKSGNDYKLGLSDQNGKFIFPCEYESIGDLIQNRMTLIKGDSAFLYDQNFILIASFKDVAPDNFQSGKYASLRTIRYSSKFGLVNYKGQIVIQAEYDSPLSFEHDLAVVSKGRLRGLIKRDGTEVLPCEYEWIYKNNQGTKGYYQLHKGNLFGIADEYGGIILPAVYKNIVQAHNSIYKISGENYSGLIDLNTGRLLLDTVYRSIIIVQNDNNSKGILAIRENRLSIYTLDNQSDSIKPYPFKNLTNLRNNRAVVDQYIVDTTGKIVFETTGLNLGAKASVGIFRKDNYSGLVNRDGIVKFKSKPDQYITELGRNYFAVFSERDYMSKEVKVQVVDGNGNTVKLPDNDGVGQYLPSINGFWIKPAGQHKKMGGDFKLYKLNAGYIAQEMAGSVRDFGTGVWVLSKSIPESQVHALMSPKGKPLSAFVYNWAYPIGKKMFYVQDINKKQSLVNLSGQLKYDNILNVSLPLNGYFIVKSSSGVSLIDSLGTAKVKFSPAALSSSKLDLANLLNSKSSTLFYSSYQQKEDTLKGADYYALEQSRGGKVFQIKHKNKNRELVVNNSIISYLFESAENSYNYNNILTRYLTNSDTNFNHAYVTACGGPSVSNHILPDTITNSGFSLVYVSEYSYSSSGNIIPEVRNYRFKGDTLAELITTTDIISGKAKPPLNELLLEKLKEKGLNIKCSDTRALVDQVWNSFTITENSLRLYFPVDFVPSEDRNPKHILQFVEIGFDELRKHKVLK